MTADQNYMKRWRAENRERIRQQQAEWRARMTPEKKAAYAERDKQRYASNPEKKREAALAWQRANPERAADRKREWAAENADRIKAQRREKYLANREASIAKSVAWGRANKDKRDAARARCAEKHPEHARATKANRRTRERAAPGDRLAAADIALLLKRQQGKCAACRCGLAGKYEIDHIEPISRGGTNHRLNFQLLCRTCNRRKGAKDPIKFMQEKGFLL